MEALIGVQKLKGVHLDSRFVWLAEEEAGRTLRAAAHRAGIINALINESKLPKNYSPVEVRNYRRSLEKWEEEHGPYPKDYFEYHSTPVQPGGEQLLLACTDYQYAKYGVKEGTEEADYTQLQVKLPTVDRPTSRKDWAWHSLELFQVSYLDFLISESEGKLSRPTLRLDHRGVLLADLVWTVDNPTIDKTVKTRVAVSVDWGEKRHFTLTDVWYGEDDTVHTSNQPHFLDTSGIQVLLMEKRKKAYELDRLIKRLTLIIEDKSIPCLYGKELKEKVEYLTKEKKNIWKAHERLVNQWAHTAANWIINHARYQGASTIYHESLQSMEARDKGKGLNARLSNQLRGKVFALLKHKAGLHGIKVREVLAPGTSSQCSRCDGKIRHHKASDNLKAGRSWATCSKCGISRDRDHAAAEHIGVRGLLLEHEKTVKQRRVRRSLKPVLTSLEVDEKYIIKPSCASSAGAAHTAG